MKHFKGFMILAVVLGIGAAVWLHSPATQLRGQDSQALTQHYNAIKAEDINSRDIGLYIDGQLVETDKDSHLWMSDDLSLMLPDHMVNDVFQCTLTWLEDGSVRLTKGNLSDTFAVTERCLPADELAAFLGYSYEWQDETNAAYIRSPEAEAELLPDSYDLREQNRVSVVRDQGSWGTCWAFAALSALESSLLPDAVWQFSVDHLVMENGFLSDVDEGGDYNMALAYLTSWQGPVTEAEDPYGDGQSVQGLSAAVHLQEAVIVNERDFDQIKSLIYHKGAVQSAIYSQPDIRELSDYYSEENAAYYYPESMECNHDIDIIGWDDNYPKENFVTQPEGDGAFICKNSWGSDFGQDGYFYISYYDSNIGIYGIAYTGVEPADNYDRLYQSDLLGWAGSIGYNEPQAWFSSIYEAEEDSRMEAVGFYATDADTYYDIYMVSDFESAEDMDRREILQSGYIADKGYYTINLEIPQELRAGERFAVVVKIYTEGSSHPIAIEYASNTLTSEADIDDGESYMSYNGKLWSHMETASECNACLKVYTTFIR